MSLNYLLQDTGHQVLIIDQSSWTTLIKRKKKKQLPIERIVTKLLRWRAIWLDKQHYKSNFNKLLEDNLFCKTQQWLPLLTIPIILQSFSNVLLKATLIL